MEIIRLQKDNIKEICDKLDNLGYEDFKEHYIPIIGRTIREDSGTVQNIKRRHSI